MPSKSRIPARLREIHLYPIFAGEPNWIQCERSIIPEEANGSIPVRFSFIVPQAMTQENTPTIFAAEKRAHWRALEPEVWSIQGADLDAVPHPIDLDDLVGSTALVGSLSPLRSARLRAFRANLRSARVLSDAHGKRYSRNARARHHRPRARALHRRTGRRLQQENRPFVDRTTPPTRPRVSSRRST